MSNCVDVYSTLLLPLESLDAEQFLKRIAECNANPENEKAGWVGNPTEDDWERQMMWWFLGQENTYIDDGYLCIDLGNHRSRHTWRDLKGTLRLIGKYVHNKDTKFPIKLRDIEAGDKINETPSVVHFDIEGNIFS